MIDLISIVPVSLFGLITFLFAFLWYHSKSTFDHWKKLNIKFIKPSPLFGNTGRFLLLREPLHETFAKLYAYFKDDQYGGFFLMRKPALLVIDPEIITNVLTKDFKHFVNRDFDFAYVNKELNPLSMHLFLVEGDRWRILRHKLSPVFTSGKLKLMYEQIFDCVNILNKFIDVRMSSNSTNLNVKEVFERFSIDVVGSVAFGLDCKSLNSNDDFRAMGAEVLKPKFKHAVRMLLAIFNEKLLHVFRVTDFPQFINDFYINVTLDTVDYRRKNNIVRNDFLQLLMGLQNTSKDPKYAVDEQKKPVLDEEFDEIDLAANAFLFFVAAYETTASTLSFCLYELALNPDIQEKLRSEVEAVKIKTNGKMTPDNLKEFTYMDMVLSETLRKYPPFAILWRQCTENYVIPGTNVPISEGTKMIIPVWSIHHDCKYYPNPEKFDPERFTQENKIARLNGTYIPFGDGPRYCIGKRFAFMEIKAVLADIILKYHFSPCDKTEIPLKFKKGSILLSASIWINITKRK